MELRINRVRINRSRPVPVRAKKEILVDECICVDLLEIFV